MRESRFRVWIERYKKYMPVAMIHFEPILGKIDYIEVVATGGDWAKFYPEEFILEQYTGLKDKNDKEICVGDVVGFKWTKRLYVVAYRRYDASFILENDEWEETIHLSLDKDNYEVIGTIHENAELLGEEEE